MTLTARQLGIEEALAGCVTRGRRVNFLSSVSDEARAIN